MELKSVIELLYNNEIEKFINSVAVLSNQMLNENKITLSDLESILLKLEKKDYLNVVNMLLERN